MADTLEGIKLTLRPRLILTDLNMTNNQALFQMIVAPLVEGSDTISFRYHQSYDGGDTPLSNERLRASLTIALKVIL